MKIGIVGLLNAQAATIQKKFPDLEIECLSKERDREVRDFATRMTKVVLMTKFISHSTFYSVPVHKRCPIDGGMTALSKYLATIPTKPAPIKESKPMSRGKIDYTILLAAQVDDTLVFPRPADTTVTKWKSQVSAVRTYYSGKGIKTTANFGSTEVKITVTEVNGTNTSFKGMEAPKPVEAKSDNAHEAQLWSNFVVARASTAVSFEQVLKEADRFVAAYHERYN